MDFNEVAIFISVVQEGSFSQAAKKLGMPNSTVSAKVSNLEKRLGVTLIQRTTRKLNITPAGQAYFKRCIQGLEEIKAAESEIAAVQGEPQGLLRITAPNELGSSILPGIVSQYIKKYPKARIEVLLTDRRVDLLSENVDLAIRAGELKDSSLIAKRIGTLYFAPFASPKYLKTKGTPTHPRELRNHSCLQFTPVGVDEWKMASAKGSLNVPIPGRILINDMFALKKMALMDDGIVFLPTYYCYQEVKSNKLIRILPEWRSHLTPIHFVYPAQRFVTPKLSAFITLATDIIKRSFEDYEI
ncbi:LysR family transcriptional regulator [Bacteriovorax stolpii]|uniref:LysR family transcriptional regulator n=1 Tax=Bacteriovorax stolpii TaxID=960 RepID=A0A2K9NUS1_BACTC|nr:LysR family transcriptional regulator [Bacteriovorax stolpii]AUN99248.1 LysR family transcriptional regulator [Bacteriovorax stolpii]QDK40771.1 LysR family transcriptional regulator [Bacteriovorax stolpii]TDP55212.1 LysR family transcriptional regulator [Bacteriovorax stolpii]